MLSKQFPLLWKMFMIYIGIVLAGTLLLTAKNIWVHYSSLEDLKKFFFGAIMFFNLIFLLLMQLITIIRFRLVNRYFRGKQGKMKANEVLLRLQRFPTELFWSMILLAIALSILFHITQIIYKKEFFEVPLSRVISLTLGSILSEMALSVTLAVMVYSLLRSALHPYIKSLRRVKIESGTSRTTLAKPFLFVFISCFIVISFDVFRIVFKAVTDGESIIISSIMKIVIVDILFSLIVVILMIWELRRELRSVETEIRSLLLGKRKNLHNPIYIQFADEIGQLAESFNAVQERISSRYKRLDEELELAYAVHQMLLPESNSRIGHFYVQAKGRGIDSVGAWYDMLSLEKERFAVVLGAFSGHGMPVALATSAAMFLLRSTIRECGNAHDAIDQVNIQLSEMLPFEMQASIGVVLFDLRKNEAEVALLGNLSFGITSVKGIRFEPLLRLEQTQVLGNGDLLRVARIQPNQGDRFILTTQEIKECDLIQSDLQADHIYILIDYEETM